MDGSFAAAVGSKRIDTHSFYFLRRVVVHPSGQVLVADCAHERVQVLNPDLFFSHSFGSHGSQAGQFNSLYNMSTDDEGIVYVTDNGNGHVHKFTLQGEFVA